LLIVILCNGDVMLDDVNIRHTCHLFAHKKSTDISRMSYLNSLIATQQLTMIYVNKNMTSQHAANAAIDIMTSHVRNTENDCPVTNFSFFTLGGKVGCG